MSRLYLLSYNSLQALGWAFALSRILINLLGTKSLSGAYGCAGSLISLLQSVAFLEVLHAAIGIVPSGVVLALMQWGGRTHFLLAIVRQIGEVQELPAVFITFFAWSISEVIRYSHYAMSGMGICPSWLTYLRYTAFIVLYPVGVAPGEMWVMYQALPFIMQKKLCANVFYHLPFNYYTFIKVLLLCYPFLWLKLYLHLFKQRHSKLRKKPHQKRQ